MANRLRGEATLSIDGVDYTLVYSMPALIALEDVLDTSIMEILVTMNKRAQRLGFVRAMLWAGLREKHPEVSLDRAAELIGEAGGMLAVNAVMLAAFQRAFPAAADDEPGPRKPSPATAAAGTSSASSNSGSSST